MIRIERIEIIERKLREIQELQNEIKDKKRRLEEIKGYDSSAQSFLTSEERSKGNLYIHIQGGTDNLVTAVIKALEAEIKDLETRVKSLIGRR